MPIVEFTYAEQQWYVRESQLAIEHVREAEVRAAKQVGKTLAEICVSHNIDAPPNAELIKDKRGTVLGIAWGREYKDWLDGAVKIDGAVFPRGHIPLPLRKLQPKEMLPPADKIPVSQDDLQTQAQVLLDREVEKAKAEVTAPAPNGAAVHS